MSDDLAETECTRGILEPFLGKRLKFRATAGTDGTRVSKNNIITVCLRGVVMLCDDGEEVFISDHIWVDRNRALDRCFVRRGDCIEFKADVYGYERGAFKTVPAVVGTRNVYTTTGMIKKRRRYNLLTVEGESSGSDFGLRRVGCVRRISGGQG